MCIRDRSTIQASPVQTGHHRALRSAAAKRVSGRCIACSDATALGSQQGYTLSPARRRRHCYVGATSHCAHVARAHLRASIASFLLRCARTGTLPAAVLATSARFATLSTISRRWPFLIALLH